jgi:hypothetical protein
VSARPRRQLEPRGHLILDAHACRHELPPEPLGALVVVAG